MNKESGAATAEFMLLMPTLVLGLAAFLALANWQLASLELSNQANISARAQVLGVEWEAAAGVEVNLFDDGRYKCVELTKSLLLPLKARACQMDFGR